MGSGGRACEFLDDMEARGDLGVRDCARVGTPGDAQAVVVRHLGPDKKPLAFSKIAASEGAVRSLANEAAALGILGGRCSPRLLGAKVVSESAFAAVSVTALAGDYLRFDAPCPSDLEKCLPAVGSAVRLRDHPWMADREWKGELELAERATRRAEVLGEWPICISHGDAAPWNALRTASGELCLFDWEYASVHGLWLFDRAYWILQTGRLIRRRTPGEAASDAVAHLSEVFPTTAIASGGLVALVALTVAARTSESHAAVSGEQSLWWRECCRSSLALFGGEGSA